MLTRVFVGEGMTLLVNPGLALLFLPNPIQTLILISSCDAHPHVTPWPNYANAAPGGPRRAPRPLNLAATESCAAWGPSGLRLCVKLN